MMDPVEAASTGSRESVDAARGQAQQLTTLLRQVATGDEQAFAELYDLTAPRLHGLIVRVLRNPAQSEEVTQEVYLDIWRTATRFDPDRGSALSWMLTIAHRRAVDRVRSAQAASDREEHYQATHQAPAYDATAETATTRLESARVTRALQDLTDPQRQAVTLAYLGGYTHTEVATLLDLPLGTAKTRIRDGLIRLRDALGVTS
ncbi:ECF RNA polymerase sigma factor SigK [Janibacter alkaliphilus]